MPTSAGCEPELKVPEMGVFETRPGWIHVWAAGDDVACLDGKNESALK